MNLENFGVQEMNAQESVSVDGGDFWGDVFSVGASVIVAQWRFNRALAAGFEAGSQVVVDAHNGTYH